MRLTLGGVPLHPALVHFPVAFWFMAPVMDLAHWLRLVPGAWNYGWWFALGGVIAALPAIAAGALDALASRHVKSAEDSLWRHAGIMATCWTVFGLAVLLSPRAAPAPMVAAVVTAAHTLGALLLAVGAHAGGRLAYIHRLPPGTAAS